MEHYLTLSISKHYVTERNRENWVGERDRRAQTHPDVHTSCKGSCERGSTLVNGFFLQLIYVVTFFVCVSDKTRQKLYSTKTHELGLRSFQLPHIVRQKKHTKK